MDSHRPSNATMVIHRELRLESSSIDLLSKSQDPGHIYSPFQLILEREAKVDSISEARMSTHVHSYTYYKLVAYCTLR